MTDDKDENEDSDSYDVDNIESTTEKQESVFQETITIDYIKSLTLKDMFLNDEPYLIETDMTLGEFFSDRYFNDATWRFCDVLDGKDNVVNLIVKTVPNSKIYRFDFYRSNEYILCEPYSIRNIGNGTTSSSATPIAVSKDFVKTFIQEVYHYYGIK